MAGWRSGSRRARARAGVQGTGAEREVLFNETRGPEED